jgi:hypothetical protein
MFDCTRNQGIELKDDVHGPVSAIKSCAFCDASQERGFAVVFEVSLQMYTVLKWLDPITIDMYLLLLFRMRNWLCLVIEILLQRCVVPRMT